MADSKLSALTAETSPADADLTYTASGAGPTSKKITWATLKSFFFSSPTITGDSAQTGGIPTVGGDGSNPGAIQLKPANAAYNWYSWVNKETGSNEGIALQRGGYPAVVSTPLTVSSTGVMSTPAGTVSQLGYVIPVSSTFSTPADSTTYYFGSVGITTSTTPGFYKIRILRAGTIKRISLENFYFGTQPSDETSTINLKVNNGTNNVIDTGFHNETNGAVRTGAYSIPVALDEYIELNWVTPAWATNPGTSILIRAWIYIE